jgi:choline dehydrogenase-like flavoprotein
MTTGLFWLGTKGGQQRPCSHTCANISLGSSLSLEFGRADFDPLDPRCRQLGCNQSVIAFVNDHHGTTGPIQTSFNDANLPIQDDLIEAAAAITDLKQPEDAWSGDHIGFFHTLGTVTRTGPNKGKRSYSGRDYDEPNASRPNLKLLTEARVNRVILDGDNVRATGVSITFHGKDYTISATREVIISAGTIQSPQILELSGIGDPDVLSAAGVECRVENRAIGANVQDHSATVVSWTVKPDVMTLDSFGHPSKAEQAVQEYTRTRGGPLSSMTSTQGFLPLKRILPEAELAEVIEGIRAVKPTTPFHERQLHQVIRHLESDTSANLQLVLFPLTLNPNEGIEHQGRFFTTPPPDQPAGLSAALCLQYPVSRGYIHIQSNGTFLNSPSHNNGLGILSSWTQLIHITRPIPSPHDPTKLHHPSRRRSHPRRPRPLGRRARSNRATRGLNSRAGASLSLS